jgi:GT2 family glycosyltransferase
VSSHHNKRDAPSVWAIVLMYGREDMTAECIDSLLGQDYSRLTVLLVDNASPDGAGARVRSRYPGIEFLATGKNLGYAGGNNRGIEAALAGSADQLLIVNNDTVLDRRCVSLLVDASEQGERVGAVAPKILYYDAPTRIAYAGGEYSMLRATGMHRRAGDEDAQNEQPGVEEITFVTGSCFLMPADVARALGGFREDFFMYCEDAELSLRARRAGYRLYYQPVARALHREPMNQALPSPQAAFLRDRNRRRLVRLHYTMMQRAAFACWFYPSRLVRLAQYALHQDWAGARAIIAGAVER